MAKPSDLARAIASIDAQLAALNAARAVLVDVSQKPKPVRKPRTARVQDTAQSSYQRAIDRDMASKAKGDKQP